MAPSPGCWRARKPGASAAVPSIGGAPAELVSARRQHSAGALGEEASLIAATSLFIQRLTLGTNTQPVLDPFQVDAALILAEGQGSKIAKASDARAEAADGRAEAAEEPVQLVIAQLIRNLSKGAELKQLLRESLASEISGAGGKVRSAFFLPLTIPTSSDPDDPRQNAVSIAELVMDQFGSRLVSAAPWLFLVLQQIPNGQQVATPVEILVKGKRYALEGAIQEGVKEGAETFKEALARMHASHLFMFYNESSGTRTLYRKQPSAIAAELDERASKLFALRRKTLAIYRQCE